MPLTDVAPRRIHAALVQLAGTCRQTLVYVWVFKEKRHMSQRKRKRKRIINVVRAAEDTEMNRFLEGDAID